MTTESQKNGADIELEIGGQKANLRNIKSLNTIATVATLVLVCVLGYAFYVHTVDTKDAGKELVQAMREMTQAARESNCLMAIPMDRREGQVELCKRLSR